METISHPTKRILLIDDEELVVKTIRKLLEREGYEVLVCRGGDEAVETAKKENFDLIVSDVRMPRMNGLEALKKIREILKAGGKKAVREILVTGFAEEAANAEAEKMKVADYDDTLRFL